MKTRLFGFGLAMFAGFLGIISALFVAHFYIEESTTFAVIAKQEFPSRQDPGRPLTINESWVIVVAKDHTTANIPCQKSTWEMINVGDKVQLVKVATPTGADSFRLPKDADFMPRFYKD